MERYLLHLFITNCLLTIADASVGYRVVPLLLARRYEAVIHDEAGVDDPYAPARRAASVRRLLAGMVALYMFCSCYAYTRNEPLVLAIITGILLLDITIQGFLFFRFRRGGER
jgi:hypothetical protein